MDETTSAAPQAAPQQRSSVGRILAVVLPIALLGLYVYWRSTTLETRAREDMATAVVARMFTSQPMPTSRVMNFPDADQDLVADPPSDSSKLISPDPLVFSYVASEEESAPDETWTELIAAIKEKTGREVKLTSYATADEQLAALQKGELHIAGLNTGLVPVAVERDGFVPLCTFGQPDGSKGYTMEFLVPADSKIDKPEQIKGHKVTFTRLDSNSGCKAPLVVLMQQFNLMPERDYDWGFSQGHEDSIKRVAAKEFEVAPVASDMLARMIKNGEVDPKVVKSIYKSERFPPATFGYVYNLAPELRDKIREAMLTFDWKGTGLEKEFGPDTVKFVEVNYKDDWANTRRIDDVIAEARKASSSAAASNTVTGGEKTNGES
jgi:phosphonate transport system substrate-binding protein